MALRISQSQLIEDAKSNLPRAGKHQGGGRPFCWRFGQANGHSRTRELIRDAISHQLVANTIARAVEAAGGTA